jgi:hypothetical protein
MPTGASRNRRGLPMTCRSSRAAELYRAAEHRILNSLDGVSDLLDRALALEPSFALAHIAREAFALGNRAADWTGVAARCERHEINGWERGHVDALLALSSGTPNAEEIARAHLRDVPQDLLVLSSLASQLFFCGGPRKRLVVLDLYESVAAELGDEPAFLARLGFAASEIGQHERGRALLEEALRSEPRSLYAIHGMAHLLHDTGDYTGSSALLDSWLRENPSGGSLYGHVQWHLATAEWAMGRRAEARARYDRHCGPEATSAGPMLALADAGGWLFRCHLDGVPASELPSCGVRELVDRLRPAWHQPFVALHATAALAALQDTVALGDCLRAVERSAPPESVAVRIARAVAHHSEERYRETVEILESLTPGERESVGGSNVERELIELLQAKAEEAGAG